MGKPEMGVKKRDPQKSPISKIWISTFISSSPRAYSLSQHGGMEKGEAHKMGSSLIRQGGKKRMHREMEETRDIEKADRKTMDEESVRAFARKKRKKGITS